MHPVQNLNHHTVLSTTRGTDSESEINYPLSGAIRRSPSPINEENNASLAIPYLVFGNINGLVKDDPDGGLPASRMRRGALVRHEALRVRQEAPQGQVLDRRVGP